MNLSRLISVSAAGFAVCAASLCASPLLASAQVAPDASLSVGVSASLAARDEAMTRKHLQEAADRAAAAHTLASGPAAPATNGTPLPQITDSDVSKPGFLGDPITYEADISSMFSGGNTRHPTSNLPGGVDASVLYRIFRTTRVAAYYYQFSADALGSEDPNVPVVFQGTHTPIASVNLQNLGADATTHLRFQIYSLQQMFFVGGKHHPLIFAPVYGSVRSIVAGRDDSGTIFAGGRPQTVHQRSVEFKSLNLAIPLFYAENYLISYTGGVTWNMNTNGANQTNHPQYTQTLYTQYQPDDFTTFFASAGKTITYFPTEVYPYNSPTFHMGFAKTIHKPFFFEGEISTGGPSNPNYNGTGRIGVTNLIVPCANTARGGPPTLTCVTLANNGVAVPFIGGQRYTTFTLMLGIGTPPLARPF